MVAQHERQMENSTSAPLPIDILLDIFARLPLSDIASLRRTCKKFLCLTCLRSIWYRLLRSQVLDNNLPIPGLSDQDLSSLPAEALEASLRRALRLRANWTSSSPIPTREFDLPTPKKNTSRSAYLGFLPGRNNRWLITSTMAATPRRFVIQCWDVDAETPVCVATAACGDSFGGLVINDDPAAEAILALQFTHTQVYKIDFSCRNPETAFVHIREIQGMRGLHLLSGSRLVTKSVNGDVTVFDVNSPEICTTLQNPSHPEPETCQAVLLRETFIIVIRLTSFEIYALSANLPSVDSTVLHPVAQHRWQWRTDTVCAVERTSSLMPQLRAATGGNPISLLIRFGSMFPWPINILHHFVLSPDPLFDPLAAIAPQNLPYLMQPKLVQSIASPIRLFAASHVTLGQYGTAVFIDSSTEDYFGHSDHGQRLGGEVLSHATIPDDNGDGNNHHAPSGSASMVFQVKASDQWIRAAMSEESGRIAIGCVDGGVHVLEYV